MSEKKHTKKAVYTGRRYRDDGKLVQEFQLLDSKAKPLAFQGIKSVWIGRAYFTNGDQMQRRPERVPGFEASDEAVTKWELLDKLAEDEAQRDRTAKKLQKHPRFYSALSSLREITRGLKPAERRKLVELIVEAFAEEEMKAFNDSLNLKLRKLQKKGRL